MNHAIKEDDFLIQKKVKILTIVFIAMAITGILVSIFELMQYGLDQRTIIQVLGTAFIIGATTDLFLRRNIHQSAIVFSIFSLIFLNIRYYHYSIYMAPSILWLTALAPSITWVTGKRFGNITLIAVFISIIANGLILFSIKGIQPNRADVIFLVSSLIVTTFLTYVIAQTQEIYYHHLEEKITVERREIHHGQLASLGELAGNIAHEINNPLQVIKGNSSLLSRRLSRHDFENSPVTPELAETWKKYALNIDRTADRTKSIVESLLKLSKRPDAEVNLCESSLSKIWNEAYPLLENKIRQSKTAISFFNMEKHFQVQPEYMAQILINLVNNSLHEIGQKEDSWIRIEFRNDHIKVVDSGPGLSEELQKNILTPFFTTKGNQGTGLGLPLCSSLMKQMGGSLEIPEKQEHATIKLNLPQVY